MQGTADQKHKALDTKIQALIQDDLVTVYERGDNYATLLVQPPSVRKPKHLMHIVLCAVTAGIWVPVYFGLLALHLWASLEGGRQHLKRIEVLENGSVRESSEPVNGWISETPSVFPGGSHEASQKYIAAERTIVQMGFSYKLHLLEDGIEVRKKKGLLFTIPKQNATIDEPGGIKPVTIKDSESGQFVSDAMIKSERAKLHSYLASS
jgi:hypothetical protein